MTNPMVLNRWFIVITACAAVLVLAVFRFSVGSNERAIERAYREAQQQAQICRTMIAMGADFPAKGASPRAKPTASKETIEEVNRRLLDATRHPESVAAAEALRCVQLFDMTKPAAVMPRP